VAFGLGSRIIPVLQPLAVPSLAARRSAVRRSPLVVPSFAARRWPLAA
jgi:hypothetical protein